ncbi:CoA transferase [Bacillus sp. JCM 19041]|uniref:CaiB/BaiF CoA transferase family protein n=1 Tax=Bacillus sp. JCM 19041 TaxID=1460637 RepID=UPI0006CF3233
MKGALGDLVVLDFSRVLAGPYCTMLLADMGAEVIKIEKPDYGDDSRFFGPFQEGESAYFAMLNRGKKSVTLDLKSTESIQMIQQFVKEADVVVENFRPGVMERLGLGYESLSAINPKIVYASISGFGQYGPYRERPAYDLVAQAMGGMMSMTGFPGHAPTRAGSSLGDMGAALYTAYGIMVALHDRERTGLGQYVDVAMTDSMIALLESNMMRFTSEKTIPEPSGAKHPISAPFDCFKTNDHYLVIAVANDALFAKLCSCMDRVSLCEDSRYRSDVLRASNEASLKKEIEEWLSRYSVEEAVARLTEYGIPCAPIHDVRDIYEDEHTWAREMLVEVKGRDGKPMIVTGNPVKLSRTPANIGQSIPELGEHTAQMKRPVGKQGVIKNEF